MKKGYPKFVLFTLLCFLFCMPNLKAQTTLTSTTTNPTVGESFINHSYDASLISPGSSGANVTWDFSTIVSTGTSTYNWITSSSTPYSSSYPNANLAISDAGYYYYYSASSTDYSSCGGTNPSAQVISYSDLEKQLVFPMTYNTTFSDAFAATYDAGSSMFMNRAGTMTGVADGYGTLILPYGTITDVLRVKLVEDYQDSYLGTPMVVYSTEAYAWYKAGVHQSLFSHTTFVMNGNTTIYGRYIDASHVGIDNNEVHFGLNIYPNPSFGSFNIELYTNNKNTLFEVVDIYGKIVYQIEYSNTSFVKDKIDLSILSKGIYIVRVTAEDCQQTKKIVIQ
jgi:hypothetical protein